MAAGIGVVWIRPLNAADPCAGLVGMKLIRVGAGRFMMGEAEDDEQANWYETPAHTVVVSQPFYISATEVTVEQFREFRKDFEGTEEFYPYAAGVSWYDAAAFCEWLSRKEGRPYRLPTEAEWEYAARAGTTTSTYNGTFDEDHLCCERPNPALDPVAWFCGEDDLTMHPVGQKQPNSWGLYDMLGNQWEWCHDFHADYPPGPATDPWGPPSGTPRVQRGGCFHMCAFFARSAYHGASHPDNRDENSGFRPVRTLP